MWGNKLRLGSELLRIYMFKFIFSNNLRLIKCYKNSSERARWQIRKFQPSLLHKNIYQINYPQMRIAL